MVIFYPSLSITMQNKLFWWLKRVTLGCEMAHLRHQNNLFYFLMCLLFDPIRRSTVHLMIFIPHRMQIAWQQPAAEGGLAAALRSDEQGYDGIAMLAVLTGPLCYHGKHPFVKVLFPKWVVGFHTTCQLAHAVVFAVPAWQVAQVVFHGVILWDEV